MEGRTAEPPSENKTMPAFVCPSREQVPIDSVVASPVGSAMREEEDCGDGDMVESFIRMLKGTRPELLRTSTYYQGAKHAYTCVAGLPVLRSIAPTVEAVVESLVDMTHMKPTPEEQAEQGSLAALDRKLMETFSYTDEILDVQKDETIERILSMKKVVAGFSPVHSAVNLACSAGDGVEQACGLVNETAGGVWQQVWESAAGTCASAATRGKDAAQGAVKTAGTVVDQVSTTTDCVVKFIMATAGTVATKGTDAAEGAMNTMGTVVDQVSITTDCVVKYIMATAATVAMKGKDAAEGAMNTMGTVVDRVSATTDCVVESIMATAGSSVEGVESAVGDTASAIGSSWEWAVSSTLRVFGEVLTYSVNVVKSVLPTKTNGPPPEE